MQVRDNVWVTPIVEDENASTKQDLVLSFVDDKVTFEFNRIYKFETLERYIKLFQDVLSFRLSFNYSIRVEPTRENMIRLKEDYGRYIYLDNIEHIQITMIDETQPLGDKCIDAMIYWMGSQKIISMVKIDLSFPINNEVLFTSALETLAKYNHEEIMTIYRAGDIVERVHVNQIEGIYWQLTKN